MDYILELSFTDEPDCLSCVLSIPKYENYVCPAIRGTPNCPGSGCLKNCPLKPKTAN